MPTSQKPLLYSYIRFSTIEQEKGHSLSRQLSYAKKVAEDRGLFLDENLTMKDLGLSAYHKTNISRGALGVFLTAVEQGRVPRGSILVIESLDRISRAAPLESQGIIAQIINADITVITAVDGKEYNKWTIKKNPMDLVYIILVLIRANEESETKSMRVRAAIMKQIEDWQTGKRGFRVKCGKAPNWVRWCENERQFVFVPREKEIMLRKIELFRKGYGGLRIAELLNSEFGSGTVHHTGANVYKEVIRRTLVGEMNVKVGDNEYVLKDYYPAILTLSEFEQLLSDSKNRGATKHKQKFVGILGGVNVFKCAACGQSVNSHVTYRRKDLSEVPSSHKRYGCVEARRKNKCGMKETIQVEVIENAVVRFCQDKVNLNRILLNDDDREVIKEKISKLNADLAQIELTNKKLIDALVELDDAAPQAIIKKMKDLEKDAAEIHQKIEDNNSKLNKVELTFRDDVTDRWLQLTKNLKSLSGEERLKLRQLVKDTFKKITLQVPEESSEESDELSALFTTHMMEPLPQDCFELTFEFHNEKKRLIRIHKYSGELFAGFDL